MSEGVLPRLATATVLGIKQMRRVLHYHPTWPLEASILRCCCLAHGRLGMAGGVMVNCNLLVSCISLRSSAACYLGTGMAFHYAWHDSAKVSYWRAAAKLCILTRRSVRMHSPVQWQRSNARTYVLKSRREALARTSLAKLSVGFWRYVATPGDLKATPTCSFLFTLL